MKKYLPLFSALLLSLPACTSREDVKNDNEFFNDFETLGYWTESPRVIREAAHSGNFCTYTDSTTPYSQTFVLHGKDIKNKDISAVKAMVWVMSQQTDAKAKFVISIEKDGKNMIWQGIETQRNMREANKWVDISMKIDLKEKITDDMILKMYGLNDGARRVYWDDFRISFEK